MAKDIPPEKKGELAKEEEERLTAVIVTFARAVLQVQIYGMENPLSQKILEDCYELLTDIAREGKEFIIYTYEGNMNWGGFPIAEKHPVVERLVKVFGKDRMVSIGFSERMTLSELTDFLDVLSMKPEDILAAGGIEKLMGGKAAEHIRINPVTYELVDEDDKIKATIEREVEEKIEDEEEAASEVSVESEDYKGDEALEGEVGFSDEDLAAGRKKPRILIIDEDVEFLASMKGRLQPEGYAVATTRLVSVALEILRGAEVELVICGDGDRIDAIKTLELITRNYPGTMKILMTAQPDLNLAVEAINRTALYKFIIKPWDTQEMKRSLKFAFRQRKVIIADELLSEEIKRREAELRGEGEKLSVE